MRYLFSEDPAIRSRTYFVPEGEQGGAFRLITEQEVTPLLEHNQTLRQSGAPHDRKSGVRRVASVPLGVWHEARQRGIFGKDHKATARFLNDPDNRPFRTDDTHV